MWEGWEGEGRGGGAGGGRTLRNTHVLEVSVLGIWIVYTEHLLLGRVPVFLFSLLCVCVHKRKERVGRSYDDC